VKSLDHAIAVADPSGVDAGVAQLVQVAARVEDLSIARKDHRSHFPVGGNPIQDAIEFDRKVNVDGIRRLRPCEMDGRDTVPYVKPHFALRVAHDQTFA
jgi:chloramphenicol 3-O-phosphotransferase